MFGHLAWAAFCTAFSYWAIGLLFPGGTVPPGTVPIVFVVTFAVMRRMDRRRD